MKTFEEFWELETRPGEDVCNLFHEVEAKFGRITDKSRVLIGKEIYQHLRRIAWIAWLDGRMEHNKTEPAATSPVYITTDPADWKRKLAALGRVVSGILVRLNSLTMGTLAHQTEIESDVDDLERRTGALQSETVAVGRRLDELSGKSNQHKLSIQAALQACHENHIAASELKCRMDAHARIGHPPPRRQVKRSTARPRRRK